MLEVRKIFILLLKKISPDCYGPTTLNWDRTDQLGMKFIFMFDFSFSNFSSSRILQAALDGY